MRSEHFVAKKSDHFVAKKSEHFVAKKSEHFVAKKSAQVLLPRQVNAEKSFRFARHGLSEQERVRHFF